MMLWFNALLCYGNICLVRFAIALNWFKPHMKVIDRTKAVTQHFLDNSFKKLSIKKIRKKNKKIYVF